MSFCGDNMQLLMRHQKVFLYKECKKLHFKNPTDLFMKSPECWNSLSQMFDMLYRKAYLL